MSPENFRPENEGRMLNLPDLPENIKNLKNLSEAQLLQAYEFLLQQARGAGKLRDITQKQGNEGAASSHQENVDKNLKQIARYETEIDERAKQGKMERPASMSKKDEKAA